jgi:hypothetical protein
VKLFAASREQFVYIGLVADVEDEMILGRVKNVVHRQCQLDHPEVGAKVSAGFREHRNQLFADLFGKDFQLRDGELFYIERGIY